MTAVRVATGALGLAAIAWGAWLMTGFTQDQLVSAGIWLAGGVLVHDAVIAPLTVLVGVALVRLCTR